MRNKELVSKKVPGSVTDLMYLIFQPRIRRDKPRIRRDKPRIGTSILQCKYPVRLLQIYLNNRINIIPLHSINIDKQAFGHLFKFERTLIGETERLKHLFF